MFMQFHIAYPSNHACFQQDITSIRSQQLERSFSPIKITLATQNTKNESDWLMLLGGYSSPPGSASRKSPETCSSMHRLAAGTLSPGGSSLEPRK